MPHRSGQTWCGGFGEQERDERCHLLGVVVQAAARPLHGDQRYRFPYPGGNNGFAMSSGTSSSCCSTWSIDLGSSNGRLPPRGAFTEQGFQQNLVGDPVVGHHGGRTVHHVRQHQWSVQFRHRDHGLLPGILDPDCRSGTLRRTPSPKGRVASS